MIAVDHPRQPPIVADDDVRILVEGEEGRERRDPLADVAPHQQPALRRHIVAERQLGEIAAVERDDQPSEIAAEHDAAVAFVRRQAVALALRIVEFLLPGLDVDVGVGQLAEIDLRTLDRDRRNRALHRHVAQHQRRQSFRREAVDRRHRDAVAVGVDQLLVDPVAAAFRQFLDVQLACGEHHLANRSVHFVAIDVDVGEVVVGADFLDLAQRVLERAPVPQPDVLQRRLIARRVNRFEAGLGGEGLLRDAIERVGPSRHLDVVPDVGRFLHQFVRLDDEAGDVPAEQADAEKGDRGRYDRGDQPADARRRDGVDQRHRRAEDERGTDDQRAGQRDVCVGVGGAREDGVILEQALEASEVGA